MRRPADSGSKLGLSAGFTLIELLITITVAAVIMGIAVPSFVDFVVKNRLKTQASELRLTLASARVEAIRRGMRVVVCPWNGIDTLAGAKCTTAAEWANGWFSFADADMDGTYDANEATLDRHAALEGGDLLTGPDKFVFRSDGTVVDSGSMTLCSSDTDYEDDARAIKISNVGRVRVLLQPFPLGVTKC